MSRGTVGSFAGAGPTEGDEAIIAEWSGVLCQRVRKEERVLFEEMQRLFSRAAGEYGNAHPSRRLVNGCDA